MVKNSDQQQFASISITVSILLLSEIDRIVARGYSDREEFVKEAIRRYIEHLKATRGDKHSNSDEQAEGS